MPLSRFTPIKKKYHTGIDTSSNTWLNLHRNENLFLDDHVIKEFIIRAVNNCSVIKYPDPNTGKLKKKLAEFHGVLPENIFVGNGADEVLSTIFQMFRKNYDKVTLLNTGFKMYPIQTAKFNYAVKKVMNFPEINVEELISQQGLFVLDSPNSITGGALPEQVFNSLLDNPQNMVVWDNVHGNFGGDQFREVRSNLIVVKHFSHFYGLAGLRLGYCIAIPEIVNELNKFRDPFSVNCIAQEAGIICLDEHEYFEAVKEKVLIAKAHFEKDLRALGFELSESVSNYVFMQHKEVSSHDLNAELAGQLIATRYYPDDKLIENYIRVTIPPAAEIKRVIDDLYTIVKNAK